MTNAFNYNDFEKTFVEHNGGDDDRLAFLNENEKKNGVPVDVEMNKIIISHTRLLHKFRNAIK